MYVLLRSITYTFNDCKILTEQVKIELFPSVRFISVIFSITIHFLVYSLQKGSHSNHFKRVLKKRVHFLLSDMHYSVVSTAEYSTIINSFMQMSKMNFRKLY